MPSPPRDLDVGIVDAPVRPSRERVAAPYDGETDACVHPSAIRKRGTDSRETWIREPAGCHAVAVRDIDLPIAR